uniref:TIL domain-containing protein n=1 Tax=Panagrolaimus davidi TaxID=227884 RepID=A0A914QMC0_9BILA
MTKLLIVCFVFIFIVSQNSDAFPSNKGDDVISGGGLTASDCRWDEDFYSCGGCPKSCKNPNPKCETKCKASMCLCKEGTVRATDGQCIKPEECPPRFLN